jgi:hypothetical protein
VYELSNHWVDATGNLWMFGGYGAANTNSQGDLNDLWKWDGSAWTFVGGNLATEAHGVYGTQGIAAAANTPGSRYEAASWTDSGGNFWLYGGLGLAASGNRGDLAVLWRFSAGQWT